MFVKKLKKSKKGFTLLEMLVSIAIFGIVSVIMTGIVLNMASVSYTVDRRTDFLNELEATVNNVKNEMRNAQSMGLCNGAANQPKSLYVVRKPITRDPAVGPVIESIQLVVTNNRLSWMTLTGTPTAGNCQTTGAPEFLSNTTMMIQNLSVVTSTDSGGQNVLLFTSFEACDAPSVKRKVFSCDTNQANLNPYRYMFAITTRNF